MAILKELRFCWWNVQDFAHFDSDRSSIKRWPRYKIEYEEKARRVDGALTKMYGTNPPEILGLCEITKKAALDLRQRLLPQYNLALSSLTDEEAFQVALFTRKNIGLSQWQPFVPNAVSLNTRPMCVVEYVRPRQYSMLFVACHWPALEEDSSKEARRRFADCLRDRIYEYLYPPKPVSDPRHVFIFGDFNTEPHDDLFSNVVYASRDRDFARKKRHYSDEDVKRTRLYNCGWRFCGEELPHGTPELSYRRVGTYYSATWNEWRTYDQVLVTGGLLTNQPPFLDEESLLVQSQPVIYEGDKPAKFRYAPRSSTGLSDHYPITGRIVLQ